MATIALPTSTSTAAAARRSGEPRFGELLAQADFAEFSLPEARRSIVEVEVPRVSDSCGFGVPLMGYEGMLDHHSLSTASDCA